MDPRSPQPQALSAGRQQHSGLQFGAAATARAAKTMPSLTAALTLISPLKLGFCQHASLLDPQKAPGTAAAAPGPAPDG